MLDVVSLFDGISCAYVALQKANKPIKSYKAFEIDKYAIAVSTKNHPAITHCGDVRSLTERTPCDLLIGGSPCIDLSIAKAKRKGLEGEYSSLFYEYLRIKNLLQPRWFVLENVASMRQSDKDIISRELGVQPVLFDAGLVSAQRRKRLFWTNIPFTLPDPSPLTVADILQPNVEPKYFISETVATTIAEATKPLSQGLRVYPITGKSVCLGANGGGVGAKTGLYNTANGIRRLTPVEAERLQGLPDDYTAPLSDTQRYKCCGNAFNTDVVARILSGL